MSRPDKALALPWELQSIYGLLIDIPQWTEVTTSFMSIIIESGLCPWTVALCSGEVPTGANGCLLMALPAAGAARPPCSESQRTSLCVPRPTSYPLDLPLRTVCRGVSSFRFQSPLLKGKLRGGGLDTDNCYRQEPHGC